MLITEVNQLADMYAIAAVLAKGVGFTGAQINPGHGSLRSQFLSTLFNHRIDQLDSRLTQEDAIETIRILDQTSIDPIEISGGTYFPEAKTSFDISAGII